MKTKEKLRKELAERAKKAQPPQADSKKTTPDIRKELLQASLVQRAQVRKAKLPQLVQTIEAKADQLEDLYSELANLKDTPAIKQKIQKLAKLAQEILNLDKQAQEQKIEFDQQQIIREMCGTAIMRNAIIEQKELPAAIVSLVTDATTLGCYYDSQMEYQKASSCFKQSISPKDQFSYFYFLAKHFHSLKPVDVSHAETNYREAEKIVAHNRRLFSNSDTDELYENWAMLYYSTGQKEKAEEYLKKGAKLGGKECHRRYFILFPLAALLWSQKTITQQGYMKGDEKESKRKAKLINTLKDLDEKSSDETKTVIHLDRGEGREKNLPKIRKMLALLKMSQDPAVVSEIEFLLGMLCFMCGNLSEGVRYIQSAASNNHVAAQVNLALFHETGWGVEANLQSAENFFAAAAKTSHSGHAYYQDFLQRQLSVKAITQVQYQKKLKQLGDAQFKDRDFIPIMDPYTQPTHLSKKSFDSATDITHCSRMNILIKVIAENPALYVDGKIRAFFFHIAMANILDSHNLVSTFFIIGKLFVKINNASHRIISEYTSKIGALIDRLRDKAHELKTSEIAQALDGLSKFHLDPEHPSTQDTIVILLNYARKNITSFSPIHLSMMVCGLIRIGLSWKLLSQYLESFLQEIPKCWEKFDFATLARLAYMLATLDVDQLDDQNRLVSFIFLNQLCQHIQTRLPIAQFESMNKINTSTRSQLDLALRYFSKRYRQHKEAIPYLSSLHKDFQQTGIVKVPQGKGSNFQDQVYNIIKKQDKSARPEVQINGLRPDIVIGKRVVGVHGPSHFVYLLGDQKDAKTIPRQTPKDRFHDKLYEQAGYRAQYVPYFAWEKLRTDEERVSYLSSEEIITVPAMTS